MKKNLHPQAQKVIFQDMMTGKSFLVDTTMQTAESALWSDGHTYPLIKVEISSSSHPAFTGEQAVEGTGSRRENFEKKYSKQESVH